MATPSSPGDAKKEKEHIDKLKEEQRLEEIRKKAIKKKMEEDQANEAANNYGRE